VRDARRLGELISSFRPDRVFHLGAQSYPAVSLLMPRETMEINAVGTINLPECWRASALNPVGVVACSSRRALIDVPVMVRTLWLPAEGCLPGEVYNVGSTQIYAVQEIIDLIRSLVKTKFEI